MQQGRKYGGLWAQIRNITDVGQNVSIAIFQGMVKKIGNGASTIFWLDV